MMTYGSICTGYDGIGRGLRLAGVPADSLWCAENEASLAPLLTSPNLGDIKAVDWTGVERVDVMSSGDPCQSISVAGRKLGREDPRFLWPWVRDAYRAVRPGVIVFENVAGIVSHDGGRTLAERFEHLREDGYAVRWAVIGACAVGAPHHRHRWYAVARHVGAGAPEAVRVGGTKQICGAPRSGGRALLPTPSAADGSGGPGRSDKRTGGDNLRTAVTLLPTPRATDGTNGGPNQRNSRGGYDALPGAVVNLLPTPVAYADSRSATAGRSPGSLFTPGWTLADVAYADTWDKYAGAIALWESITGTPAPAPTESGPNGGVRLNPALPEWMMGLRPGVLTENMSRNDALKAAGNGVVPLQAAAAWRLLTD